MSFAANHSLENALMSTLISRAAPFHTQISKAAPYGYTP